MKAGSQCSLTDWMAKEANVIPVANGCYEQRLGLSGARLPTIILTPGTLSLSSYLTCIFLTVTCTLLIILAVREAQKPCGWEEVSGEIEYLRNYGYQAGM